MSDNFELGYTPNNLKRLLKESGRRREDYAEFAGKSLKSVHCNCVDADNKNHQSLSHRKWLEFLQWINLSHQERP